MSHKYNTLLTYQEKAEKYLAIGLTEPEIQLILAPLSKLPPEALKPALLAKDKLEKLVRDQNEKEPTNKKGLFHKEEESRSQSA